MYEQDDLFALFKEEAAELIEQLAAEIEAFVVSKPEGRRDTLSVISRIVHNLKGASKTVGHNGFATLCHTIEEDLLPFQNAPMVPDEVGAMLRDGAKALQIVMDSVNDADASVEGITEDGAPKEIPEEASPSQRAMIRVDSRGFDTLIGFSSDLMMSRARMEERHRRLKRIYDKLEREVVSVGALPDSISGQILELQQLIQADTRDLIDFDHLTDEMTDTMKRLRMVPLRMAQREWREVVRKAGVALRKEVDIAIHTGDIQIDKRVLDQLRDPMMHLLRNATDHGIEAAADRRAVGKSPEGRIEINAAIRGAMVQLTVRDDGRGLDRETLRKTAVRLGVVEPRQLDQLADEALLDLVFQPGFSTAKAVTDVSGRGVGLDVVRSRVESLGGRVSIVSPPGTIGTTFALSVPISIMSTVGLHVKCGSTAYALPLEYVERTIQVNDGDLAHLDGQLVYQHDDGDPIRLVQLSALVGDNAASTQRSDKVVVLSRSNVLLGVLVDNIDDHYEFVTHPLPWNLVHTPGVSGGSLRPNGTVVVVLDIPFLFDKAAGISDTRIAERVTDRATRTDTLRILVADDSLAARTMQKNILLSGGYDVSVVEDGAKAWQRLQDETFDLLVSDVDMPNLNGLELTRRIRSSDTFRDLPVILVTSMDSAEARAAGADAGADEYVVKGTFDQQALLDVISRYM